MPHKILFRRLGGLVLLVLAIASVPGAFAARPAARPPEAVVQTFYSWYLQEQAQDREPRSDKRTMEEYVSPSLLRAIERMERRDEIDADYFMKSQDYLEDWVTNIEVARAEIKGMTATTIVTLGPPGTGTDSEMMKIVLQKEHGTWKITQVTQR